MSNAYPLILEPILKPKVWGGRRLAEYGKHLPADEPTGESWELADLSSTSTSGGGGDSAHSTIANGELQGKTIRDAIEQWGTDLLGDASLSSDGGFPLLVKYLDAREHLSIQVHPSPAYASAHPEAHLKTESWFILDAQPDEQGNPPVIYKGFKDGITPDDLKTAIENGTVPEIMRTEHAVPGCCHTLPSGTVHALGAGVLVAEIQTPSDTTFRVYRHNVAKTDFYTIDIVSASCESVPLAAKDDDRNTPIVVMLIKTMGASVATKDAEHQLEPGQTVLIPASITKDCALRAGPGTEAVIARVM